MAEIHDLIKGVDLFSGLNDEQLKILAATCIPRSYAKNEMIFRQSDDANHSLFIIITGQVKVFVSGAEGREAILALLSEGEFFGEMSLLDGDPRSASIKALTDSELMCIRREDFLAEIQRHSGLAMSLLAEMSRRMRKADKQISSLALMSVYGRIAGTLLELAQEQGIRSKLGEGSFCITIRNRPSHQELADMSGTTRETVSRALGHFQKRGSITLNGKELIIFDETQLLC